MQAYIYDGVRTPFGRYGGALSSLRPDDLLASTLGAIVSRTGVDPALIEDVVAGCANQAGEDARNVARHALLRAGLPVGIAGVTVNRLCGSGLAAALDAARAVAAGEGSAILACGVECMSRAPFVMAKAERAFGRDMRMFDSTIGARFPNPAIEAEYGADTMPETAENIASELDITREQSDSFAAASQEKYAKARQRGFFDDELLAVAAPAGKRAQTHTVSADEHPRPESTRDALGALRPLHQGGVVTAGNASGVNDGAAALLIGARELEEKIGKAPRARFVAGAVAGVEPRLMGLGPVAASAKALQRARLSLADMDVIEINEAFAAQVLGCLKQMRLAEDDARVNPNGGAIAIGHPLGASGARLALTAMRQLEATGGRYALVSLCIGIGQGIAAIIERCSD